MFVYIIYMVIINMIEFFLFFFFVGFGIVIIVGFFGFFVVWCRMVYFGDIFVYVLLLGLVFGFLFDINLYLVLLVCCLGMVVILVVM